MRKRRFKCKSKKFKILSCHLFIFICIRVCVYSTCKWGKRDRNPRLSCTSSYQSVLQVPFMLNLLTFASTRSSLITDNKESNKMKHKTEIKIHPHKHIETVRFLRIIWKILNFLLLVLENCTFEVGQVTC